MNMLKSIVISSFIAALALAPVSALADGNSQQATRQQYTVEKKAASEAAEVADAAEAAAATPPTV